MTDIIEMASFREQLIDLQSQLAFQEDTIQFLDTVVTQQQQQIERLNEMINILKSQMENSLVNTPATVNDRPPHY